MVSHANNERYDGQPGDCLVARQSLSSVLFYADAKKGSLLSTTIERQIKLKAAPHPTKESAPMTEDEIRRNSFAMPMHNPAYLLADLTLLLGEVVFDYLRK